MRMSILVLLAIVCVGCVSEEPKPEPSPQTEMSAAKKQEVFWDLVKAQDSGVGDDRAYSLIADRYEVEESEVRKIAVEGVLKDWPMPSSE